MSLSPLTPPVPNHRVPVFPLETPGSIPFHPIPDLFFPRQTPIPRPHRPNLSPSASPLTNGVNVLSPPRTPSLNQSLPAPVIPAPDPHPRLVMLNAGPGLSLTVKPSTHPHPSFPPTSTHLRPVPSRPGSRSRLVRTPPWALPFAPSRPLRDLTLVLALGPHPDLGPPRLKSGSVRRRAPGRAFGPGVCVAFDGPLKSVAGPRVPPPCAAVSRCRLLCLPRPLFHWSVSGGGAEEGAGGRTSGYVAHGTPDSAFGLSVRVHIGDPALYVAGPGVWTPNATVYGLLPGPPRSVGPKGVET